MVELAIADSPRPVLLAYIAKRQEIPERYLVQIFGSLRRAGLVSSYRGAKGGFQLSRAPAEITLAEILEASEGKLELVECLRDDEDRCNRQGACSTRAMWADINGQVRALLSKITLARMVEMHRADQTRLGASYSI